MDGVRVCVCVCGNVRSGEGGKHISIKAHKCEALAQEVKDTCAFLQDSYCIPQFIFILREIKVLSLLLERMELICCLATPPTLASRRE